MKEHDQQSDRQESKASALDHSEALSGREAASLSPPPFSLVSSNPIQRQAPVQFNQQLDVSALVDRIQNMRTLVSSVQSAADHLREAGTGTFFDDDDLLAEAENLTAMASDISNAADQLDQILGAADGERIFEGTTEAINRVQQVIQAARLISDLSNSATLETFLANPQDREAAYAWARHTAGIFDRAGALIPDDIPGIPSFICQYFKGLLSAPSNYVEVFIAIQEDHLARIDSVTGGGSGRAQVVDGNDVLWEGPLGRLYVSPATPQGLRSFMENHREISGIDLWEASARLGRALLLSALERASLSEFPGRTDGDRSSARRQYIGIVRGD